MDRHYHHRRGSARATGGRVDERPEMTELLHSNRVSSAGQTRNAASVVNPQALRLRAAGLRATSARIATLRAVPAVLQAHGFLTPALLRDACAHLGYTLHVTVFYRLLPDLASAGLIPAEAIRLTGQRGVAMR